MLPVGFDFSTAPLAAGVTLQPSNSQGVIEAQLVDAAGQPRPAGIIDGPEIAGTVVQARIQPAAADRYLQILVPTSDGNRIGARRFLQWY